MLFLQNQSSTLLLLVVQHLPQLSKKEIQHELVQGLQTPLAQCLNACDLESLVVLSETLMQADNRANVAATALQTQVHNMINPHCISLICNIDDITGFC